MANIKQIMLPDGTTYDITMNTVNGHTVNSDVPANAIFTDENVLAEEYNTTTGNWNYPMWRANTSDDEASVFWSPPDVKGLLSGKDPDAGKD